MGPEGAIETRFFVLPELFALFSVGLVDPEGAGARGGGSGLAWGIARDDIDVGLL
jgi:hypothetical protein